MLQRVLLFLAAVVLAGCSLPSSQQAVVSRLFKTDEKGAMAAIESVALPAGYVRHGDEFTRSTRSKRDPVLGLVKVSDEMDQGVGFTVRFEPATNGTLVSVVPVQLIRRAFKDGEYMRTPLRPGSSLHSEVLNLIENARARAGG